MPAYQGTFADIYGAVLDNLRLNPDDDTTRAKRWVNLAYAEVAQETGFLQTAGIAALETGSSSYSLPAAVAKINQIRLLYADGSVSDPLEQRTLSEILELRRSASSANDVSQPLYAIAGQNQLELWPDPATGQTMEFWYSYLPDALSGDGDTPLIQEPYGSRLLELGACVQGAKFKKDPLLAQFQADYGAELARFQSWLNRRTTGGSRQVPVVIDSPRVLRLARDVG